MTTRRLLWGMTWRGGIWGCVLGTFLTSIYGWLFFAFTTGQSSVWSKESLFSTSGLMLSIFVAVLFFSFPLLLVGLTGGFVIAILTRKLFYPLTTPFQFRRISIISGFVIGVLGFLAIWVLRFGSWDVTYSLKTDPELLKYILFPIVPALIAGFGATFVSQRLARWYERESAKAIAQNISSN